MTSIYKLTLSSSRNVTSLNDQFDDLSVTILPYRLRPYSINEVALGFINAMKLQALEDCDDHIPRYTFTDTEYEYSPIRIRIVALVGAPSVQRVRCNLMYGIKSLAKEQLTRPRLFGAAFLEYYRDELLYSGIFDNKGDASLVEPSSNSSTNTSETIAQDKRALSTYALDANNSTAILLTIPGSDDVQYRMEFDFLGSPLPQAGIFSTILDFIFTLGQRDAADAVQNVSEVSTDPAWIFVTHSQESTFSLQVFEVLAILESTARYAALQGRYQEMIFNFFIDEELVAGGCVVAPIASRRWCGGVRREAQEGSVGRLQSY